MENLCGCSQVRAERLKQACSFFLSPILICGIFEGGEVQNHGILQL